MLHSTNMLEDVDITIYEGSDLPDDAKQLRTSIYSSEMGYLTDKTCFNSWDELGAHIVVRTGKDRKAIACGHVYPAETGEFADHSGLAKEQLETGVMMTRVMTHPDFRGQGLIKLVLYACAKQGRAWGRNRMFCFALRGEKPTMQVLKYQWLPELNVRTIRGTANSVHRFHPATQRLDIAIRRSWDMMPAKLQASVVKSGIIADELVNVAETRIEQFFKNQFFKTIYGQDLSRHHYVRTLSNFHQFVRHTTRILARAASQTEDAKLRKHFLHHLSGEIDHEVQIEVDLSTLKADVEFVKNRMVASEPIEKFMCIQEALLGYRQDPLSYMAVPFGIEGFAANLDEAFVDALEQNVSRWGVKNPSRATTFIRAHIVSDGGDDGHWEQNKKAISRFIDSEPKASRFLNVLNITFDAMEEIYADFVAEPDVSVLPGADSEEEELKKIA